MDFGLDESETFVDVGLNVFDRSWKQLGGRNMLFAKPLNKLQNL
jgi:hypothetical protein